MREIIRKNPKLNEPKYRDILGIDEEEFDYKSKANFTSSTENSTEVSNLEIQEMNHEQNHIGESSTEKDFENQTSDKNYDSKNDELNREIQIPNEIHDYRTYLYGQYVIEKVKKTELGKLPFSKYVEIKAPDCTEIIEIEKKRENQAATIYKIYLRYYASVSDKTQAMSFDRFVQQRYKRFDIDIPVEYEEEEERRKNK